MNLGSLSNWSKAEQSLTLRLQCDGIYDKSAKTVTAATLVLFAPTKSGVIIVTTNNGKIFTPYREVHLRIQNVIYTRDI
jgi:hypothetical protein